MRVLFDEVALAMAMWQVDELPSADVQKLAIRFLEEGRSSPTLYELAGTPAFALGQDLQGLVEQMFAELDAQLPTPDEAALLLSRQIAADIVNGRIEPYEGAQRIYFLSTTMTWTGGWRRRSARTHERGSKITLSCGPRPSVRSRKKGCASSPSSVRRHDRESLATIRMLTATG